MGITPGANELGLRARGDQARGLLTDYEVQSVESTPSRRIIRSRRKRESTLLRQDGNSDEGMEDAGFSRLTRPELERSQAEILLDKSALHVRRRLVLSELAEIEVQIRKLQSLKSEFGNKLLSLKEEELELDDELEGVQDGLSQLDAKQAGRAVSSTSSRRRRGPAFLPSEHDDLPPNIAFMTLAGHALGSAVTALDFDEPYGTLVSSSSDPDGTVRIWDLSLGEEVGRLRGGHSSSGGRAPLVKALLVEGKRAMTGGSDGKICLWDIDIAIDEGLSVTTQKHSSTNDIASDPDDLFSPSLSTPTGNDEDPFSSTSSSKACVQLLEGHSKDVTCLSYEDSSLVSGSSDKTLRLWDLTTGQCVVTMDILWAISNPLPVDLEFGEQQGVLSATNVEGAGAVGAMSASVPNLSTTGMPTSGTLADSSGEYPWHASSSAPYMTPNRKRTSLAGLRRLSSQYGNLASASSPTTPSLTRNISDFNFVQATPPYSDGSWDMYSDFVGGLQLWSYALASGSADGCVRMWDSRFRGLPSIGAHLVCLLTS